MRWLIALVGGLVIGASLTGSLCKPLGIPVPAGQMLLGIGLRVADIRLQFLSETALHALAPPGAIPASSALPFDVVGIKSNPRTPGGRSCRTRLPDPARQCPGRRRARLRRCALAARSVADLVAAVRGGAQCHQCRRCGSNLARGGSPREQRTASCWWTWPSSTTSRQWP
ncbi:MAG: hypothetical protein U5R48_03580 [Gammaproteobacteria bacterium]|nr:hypothetical protein [Gammaproteobacteria bacterium]